FRVIYEKGRNWAGDRGAAGETVIVAFALQSSLRTRHTFEANSVSVDNTERVFSVIQLIFLSIFQDFWKDYLGILLLVRASTLLPAKRRSVFLQVRFSVLYFVCRSLPNISSVLVEIQAQARNLRTIHRTKSF
ncbi:hypothetical protein BDP27DRAFT_1448636, partial [Rhodocollybia butyracea]